MENPSSFGGGGVKGSTMTAWELTTFLSSFGLTEPHTKLDHDESEKFMASKRGGDAAFGNQQQQTDGRTKGVLP